MAGECTVTLVPDILVLGHFNPWEWLVCRILASGCSASGVSRVSRVRATFRVMDRIVRLEVVAMTALPCPTLFHTITRIAEC